MGQWLPEDEFINSSFIHSTENLSVGNRMILIDSHCHLMTSVLTMIERRPTKELWQVRV